MMDNSDKVQSKLSIIIPIYNAEKYLARCIESVLEQDYPYFQLILIDDGSSDTSWQICQKYAALDNRIEICRQKNGGPSKARNYGLQLAKGEFITFLDCDDMLICKQAYSTVIQTFLKQNVDVVVFGSEMCDDVTKEIRPMILLDEGVFLPCTVVPAIIYDNLAFGGGFPWNKVWKASAITDANKGIHFFDCSKYAYEDKLWVLENLQHVRRIATLNQAFYRYYIYEDSLSHNQENIVKKVINGLEAYDEIIDLYKNTDLEMEACARAKQVGMMVEKLCWARKEANTDMKKALKSRFLKNWKYVFHWRKCTVKLKLQTIFFLIGYEMGALKEKVLPIR